LVGGHLTPDQYTVKDGVVVTRDIADKPFRQVPSQRSGGLQTEPVPVDRRSQPALTDAEIRQLAGIVRQVEQAAGHPVDVEWALRDDFWLLQARPAVTSTPAPAERPAAPLPSAFIWSRANFMETLPDLPSPLSLALVRRFMETNIVSHYRKLGCHIPAHVSSVRAVHGRPYINVTLFQSLMAQLGGDPTSVRDQMGGEATSVPQAPPLTMSRLPTPQLFRALCRLQAQIWHAGLTGSRWFAELTRLAGRQWDRSVEQLSEKQLIERMDDITMRLEQGDLTFAIVSGVSQALYIIGATLERRLKSWRPLLNAATQGLGTIISARQILWLQELAELAAQEPAARRFFTEEPWRPAGFRQTLMGGRFVAGFDAFLHEYGHRAVGESDVMSARFAETPEYLLEIIRRHLRTALTSRSPSIIARQQAATRARALAQIRRVYGVRVHEWLWFLMWYRVLGRFLALREANRHALMRYVAAARHLLHILGNKLSERALLASAEDLFFLTDDELRSLVEGSPSRGQPAWQALVDARRNEHQRQAAVSAPHTVWEDHNGETELQQEAAREVSGGALLRGLPLSAGVVEGAVRLVLAPTDLRRIEPGDILVAPALDPGMAPVFGLAGGLIVEIGGVLSHGAIIAREYGIPAVANVTGATTRLKSGEWIRLDADRGEIRRNVPAR
jgi:pyruvate,water dikinase